MSIFWTPCPSTDTFDRILSRLEPRSDLKGVCIQVLRRRRHIPDLANGVLMVRRRRTSPGTSRRNSLSNLDRGIQIRLQGSRKRLKERSFGCGGPIRTEYTIFEHTVPYRAGPLRFVNRMFSIRQAAKERAHGQQ